MFSSDASLSEALVPRSLQRSGPAWSKILKALTPHLLYLITGGELAKWWGLHRYTWNEYVVRREAQEEEFREMYADMANDGWFSD